VEGGAGISYTQSLYKSTLIMKKFLFILFFFLLIFKSYSQDSLKIKSKYFGFSSALINNMSIIDFGDSHEKIISPGYTLSLGYCAGFSYMYAYKKLLFEFALQYSEENDKFADIPSIVLADSISQSGTIHLYDKLDYDKKDKFYFRRTLVSLLLKFNYQPLITKRLSLGLGLGFSPAILASEKFYNFQSKKYEKPYYKKNKNDFIFRGIGSINLIYFISKKISFKTAPMVFIAFGRRRPGYNIRPLSVGLELGLYFTLK
jgi:hypothetical protein